MKTRPRNRTAIDRLLTLQRLEDRTVPASYLWTGLASDPTQGDWQEPRNWFFGDDAGYRRALVDSQQRGITKEQLISEIGSHDVPGINDDVSFTSTVLHSMINLPFGVQVDRIFLGVNSVQFNGGSIHAKYIGDGGFGLVSTLADDPVGQNVTSPLTDYGNFDFENCTVATDKLEIYGETIKIESNDANTLFHADSLVMYDGGFQRIQIIPGVGYYPPELNAPESEFIFAQGLVTIGTAIPGTPGTMMVGPSRNPEFPALAVMRGAQLFGDVVIQGGNTPTPGYVVSRGANFQGKLTNNGVLQLGLKDDFNDYYISARTRDLPIEESYATVKAAYSQSITGELRLLELPRWNYGATDGAGATADTVNALLDVNAASLAGTLNLKEIGDYNDLHVRLPEFGDRTNVIKVRGAILDGRFEKAEGIGRKLDGGEITTYFTPVHYNKSDSVVQLFFMPAPILYKFTPDGSGKVYKSNGSLSSSPAGGRNLVLIAPGSSATADDAVDPLGRTDDQFRRSDDPLQPLAGARLWVDDLARLIRQKAQPNWEVATIDWAWYSTNIKEDRTTSTWKPATASRQAMDIGESLVLWMEDVGLANAFDNIHLYSHSAGSWFIDGMSRMMKERVAAHDGRFTANPYIHNTYFDAFNPSGYNQFAVTTTISYIFSEPDASVNRWGKNDPKLGEAADFAEQFIDQRFIAFSGGLTVPAVPLTDEVAPAVVNYNLTRLARDTILDLDPPYKMVALFTLLGGTYSVPTFRHTDLYSLTEIKNASLAGRLESHAWPAKFFRESVVHVDEATNADNPYWYGFRRAPEFQAPEFQGMRRAFTASGADKKGDLITLSGSLPPARVFGGGSNPTPVPDPTMPVPDPTTPVPDPTTPVPDPRPAPIPMPIPTTPVPTPDPRPIPGPIPKPLPTLVGYRQFAAGTSRGGLTMYNPDGTVRYTVSPFPDFAGSIRTAVADFNGDGVPDVVAATGPGRSTRLVILDGSSQAILFALDPFEATFTGGLFIAAGDLDGDGIADLVVTPDESGGPRCQVISGKGFRKIADFFGIDDANFRGGARASIGDVNGDGFGDLIVAAGYGGGPRVAIFDGRSLPGTPSRLVGDFFAFEETVRNGAYIAAGDIDGDGLADIIAGGGPGGGPRLLAISAAGLLDGGRQVPLANFFAGDTTSRSGLRVAVKNLDEDGLADILVGAGSGGRLTAYYGRSFSLSVTPNAAFDFDVSSGLSDGIFVG